MTDGDHLIWSNYNLDLDDWREDLLEEYPDASEAQMDRLREKIYDGSVTRADITRVTQRLGDAIGKVYGWDFPQKAHVKAHER